jgi:hypothetical protein
MGGPSAPDPQNQANAAHGESQWASMFNAGAQNPDIFDPRATITNQQTGWTTSVDPRTGQTTYIPKYSQTYKMSPGEQAVYDANTKMRTGAAGAAGTMMSNAAGMLSKPMTEQGPAWQRYKDPGYRSDIPDLVNRQQVEDNIMSSYMRTAQPEQERQRVQAAAQGNMPGGKFQFRADQQAADAMGEATRQANLQSFGMSNEAMKLRNEGRQTDWTNQNLMADQSNNVKVAQNELARSLRTGTINEIASMANIGQPEFINMPGFQSSAVQPFDIAGAQNKKFENDRQSYSDMLSGLFGLGGQALKFGFGLA